jgi:hypothetical protein
MWCHCACAKVWLPGSCLGAGFIIPLFHCCVSVLLRNGCFCVSAGHAWSKYATLLTVLFLVMVNSGLNISRQNFYLLLLNKLHLIGFCCKVIQISLHTYRQKSDPKEPSNYTYTTHNSTQDFLVIKARSWDSIPRRETDLNSVRSGCGPHPAICPMGRLGLFPRGHATGSCGWPLITITRPKLSMQGAVSQSLFIAWCLIRRWGKSNFQEVTFSVIICLIPL